MNSRNLLILAGATVAVVAGAYVATMSSSNSERSAKAAEGEPFLTGLSDTLKDVTQIEIKDPTRKVTIKRADTKSPWTLGEKFDFPIGDRIQPLLKSLVGMKILEEKTSKPELYQLIGVADLDKAGSTAKQVTLKDASGKTVAAFLVGNSGSGAPDPFGGPAAGGAVYVRRMGEAKSFQVSGPMAADTDPMSWIDKNVLQLERNSIKSVSVERHDDKLADPKDPAKGNVLETFRENEKDLNFKVRNMPPGRELMYEGAADQPTNPLGMLSIDDVAPREKIDFGKMETTATGPVKPDDKQDKFARTTAKYVTFDGMVVTVRATKQDGKCWLALDAAYDEKEAPKADEKKADDKKPEEGKAPEVKPERKKPEEVKKDVDAFNTKHGKWAYAVPEYTATQIAARLEDLLKPPAKPTTTGPEQLGPQPSPEDNILVPEPPK